MSSLLLTKNMEIPCVCISLSAEWLKSVSLKAVFSVLFYVYKMFEDIWKEEKYRNNRGIVIVEILMFFPQIFPPCYIIRYHTWSYCMCKILKNPTKQPKHNKFAAVYQML